MPGHGALGQPARGTGGGRKAPGLRDRLSPRGTPFPGRTREPAPPLWDPGAPLLQRSSQRLVGPLCGPWALPVHPLPVVLWSLCLLTLIPFGDRRVSANSSGSESSVRTLVLPTPWCVQCGQATVSPGLCSPLYEMGPVTPTNLPLFQMWLNGPMALQQEVAPRVSLSY